MCKKKRMMALVMAMTLAAASLSGCSSKPAGDSVATDGGTTQGGTTETKTDDESVADSSTAAGGSYEVATVRWADWGEDYHVGFPDEAARETGITIA